MPRLRAASHHLSSACRTVPAACFDASSGSDPALDQDLLERRIANPLPEAHRMTAYGFVERSCSRRGPDRSTRRISRTRAPEGISPFGIDIVGPAYWCLSDLSITSTLRPNLLPVRFFRKSEPTTNVRAATPPESRLA
jgi:hypothetical protein